jgi:hypothetical protein
MKTVRETVLSRLDNALRWTGIPARVADQMSDAPSIDYNHQPLRWGPIWPIAFSCALFILSLTWPPVLDRLSPGAGISILAGLMASIVGTALAIHPSGPLGKPSLEDDEREAALRKDSFLFCFGLLAFLNCLGQPVLVILSHWQNWQAPRSLVVAASAFILNATLFGCLPTLYASWKLQRLPKEG